MLNEPRRGGQSTGRRWSAKHGTPAKSKVGTTTPQGWQNDNFIHFISLLYHPFGVVDFISPSSRGYASLHHLPVVIPALRASLHNQLPYKINPNFARQFYFRNFSFSFSKWFISAATCHDGETKLAKLTIRSKSATLVSKDNQSRNVFPVALSTSRILENGMVNVGVP